MPLPTLRLRHDAHPRLRHGYPWIYSNEIQMDADARALEPGAPVTVLDGREQPVGTALFNPHSLIAGRLVSRRPDDPLDAAGLIARLQRARDLRERLYPGGFYRLVHGEADGLPGLVVDRYGDTVTIQANTAGLDRLLPDVIAALDAIVAPTRVFVRNDSPVRQLEGLALSSDVVRGDPDAPVWLVENGARFVIDPAGGQKTGWFYDHRENRAAISRLAAGAARALDVYTYAGGFAVQMALAGAGEVVAVDRSDASLALAARSAEANEVADRVVTRRGDAFDVLEAMSAAGERFDVVVVDPPAFAKSAKDAGAAARGYRKLARLAAPLVEAGGFLLAASCSHHVERDRFEHEVVAGIGTADRSGRILRTGGAGADHPIHPLLPQTAYLKSVLLQLD